MEGRRFDSLTRALATGTNRRALVARLVGSFAGGLLALRSATTQGATTCAQFCKVLPPGLRGTCVSDCQAGKGLYFACTGDPTRLCLAADGGSATCCAASGLCQGGVCGCPTNYTFCQQTGQCVFSVCSGFLQQYNPTTCQCECPPPYVPLANTGACARPCTSDADCAGVPGACKTTTEGQHLCDACGESAYPGCTDFYPCTSSAFCQSCASANNTYCADGVCYVVCI